jgi:hypothetical protein
MNENVDLTGVPSVRSAGLCKKPETSSTIALKLEADGWITTGTESMR